MKKKQIIAGVIAAILFVFIGVTSVGTNMVEKLVFNGIQSDSSYLYGFPKEDFVGIVTINGTMMDSAGSSSYFSTEGYNHEATIQYIKALAEADNNVGILLYVNSGGGYTYIGDDLYLELMKYKEVTGRPIYAYFDSIAASAAYYASMSADEIYANRMTTTGSIGVYMTVMDMTGLYEKLGIKEYMIRSGDNKGIGGGGQEVTEEFLEIEQAQVDEYYELFIDVIEKGRGMNREDIYPLADGRTFTATQALEVNLIDGISRYEDYKDQVLTYFDGDVVYYQANNVNTFTSLFGAIIESLPKSDNQVIFEYIESYERGVNRYESICH